MITIPTIIAALIAKWQGAPSLLFWGVIGFGIFAWLCGKAYLNARNDLIKGQETDKRVLRFWSSAANIVVWLQWIFCIVAIGLSFGYSWSSPNVELFKNTIRKSIDINEISANMPNIQKANPEKAKIEEQRMLTLIHQCNQLSEQIDDNFLNNLHPGLAKAFKTKLIAGHQIYANGLSSNNASKQVQAINLLMEWQDYWETNAKEIIQKIVAR